MIKQTTTTFDFEEFLINQTPVFDELIMKEVRLDDGWIPFLEKQMYVDTLNAVRKLSEGSAFKKVSMSSVLWPKKVGDGGWLKLIQTERFNHVWPNTKPVYGPDKYESHDWIPTNVFT